MKTAFLILLSFVSVFSYSQGLSREERKKIKKMSNEDIAAVIKNLESKSNELKKCNSEKEEMQLNMNAMNNELMMAKNDLDSIKKINAIQKEEKEKLALEISNSNPVKERKGIYFKVQIGAYNQYRATGLGKTEIETEMLENQIKYVLGYFTKASKAEQFRDELKKMGFEQAWIVCYQNGKRITKEEAENLGVKFSK